MSQIRIGYGKSLSTYKTKSIENKNLDIGVYLDNGDYIELCTRSHGYTLRFKARGSTNLKVLKEC